MDRSYSKGRFGALRGVDGWKWLVQHYAIAFVLFTVIFYAFATTCWQVCPVGYGILYATAALAVVSVTSFYMAGYIARLVYAIRRHSIPHGAVWVVYAYTLALVFSLFYAWEYVYNYPIALHSDPLGILGLFAHQFPQGNPLVIAVMFSVEVFFVAYLSYAILEGRRNAPRI